MPIVFISVINDDDKQVIKVVGDYRSDDLAGANESLRTTVNVVMRDLFGDSYKGEFAHGTEPTLVHGDRYFTCACGDTIDVHQWMVRETEMHGWTGKYTTAVHVHTGYFTMATTDFVHNEELDIAQQTIAELRAELAQTNATLAEVRGELAQATVALMEARNEVAAAEATTDTYKKINEQLRAELTAALDTSNDYFNSIMHLNAQVKALREAVRGAPREVHEADVIDLPLPTNFVIKGPTKPLFGMDSCLAELKTRFESHM